ncbi:hypothetical protein HanRHA438_Chr03g0135071 [Helianthus annuus]|nr:hypothetical protein HanRHA438_Chr03g0135071 [Helianthus annuus]
MVLILIQNTLISLLLKMAVVAMVRVLFGDDDDLFGEHEDDYLDLLLFIEIEERVSCI